MLKRLLTIALLLLPSSLFAAPLQLWGDVDLSMGELALPNPGPGYFEIDPFTGAFSSSNAYQIATPNRGNFRIIGSPGLNIILTMSADPMTCDLTYLPACIGTPALTPTHTFTGQISNAYCPQPPRCQDTIQVGGRFDFTGVEEGRWTTIINIIANYQ